MTTDTPSIVRREVNTPRWKAVVEYRTEHGILDVEHALEEIEELQELVERGPDRNTIVQITITLDRNLRPDLTVEGASQQ
jgi:hypothetical protein